MGQTRWRRRIPPVVVEFGILGIALLADPWPARAELIAVQQPAGGMECPECARGLRLTVGVLDGIEALGTSWNRRVLTVSFRAGSRATLEQIRTMVRARHFVPGEAEVAVRGTLVTAAAHTPGKPAMPAISVSGSGVSYRLDNGAVHVAPFLESARGRTVVVRGRVPAAVPGAVAEDPLIILVDEVKLDVPPPANEKPSAHRSTAANAAP